jgi:SAM-dependent methyltransferase
LDGKTVLEVGANKGGLSLFFSWLGCKVICSDVTAAYLAKAQDLHRQWDRCCSYLAADLRILPVRSESIDIVIMKSVLGGIYACAGRETASASLKEIYRVLRKGGCCILLEQLAGDPVSRWVRGRTSPGYEWHYFKSEEFLKPDANLLAKEFQTVSIKCLTLSSYVLEHLFSSDTLLVRASLMFDRLVEKVIHDDWKHLISVIAMK